jgi:Holliday junction resolvasome RuvABC ATP-dependent DNA helicase subunit
MVGVNNIERTVLMYMDSALTCRHKGITASEIANILGEPVKDIIAVCENLNQKDLVHIDKQHKANGKVKDMEMHILGMGISTLFENMDPQI